MEVRVNESMWGNNFIDLFGAGLEIHLLPSPRNSDLENAVVFESLDLAAANHALLDWRSGQKEFLDLVRQKLDQVLRDRSKSLAFPYRKEYEMPCNVALRIICDEYESWAAAPPEMGLEWMAHDLDELLAEIIARGYVQRLYRAEIYGANMPSENVKQVIKNQLHELESNLLNTLIINKPILEEEELKSVVQEALEFYYERASQVDNPYAKKPIEKEIFTSIIEGWEVGNTELDNRLKNVTDLLKKPQMMSIIDRIKHGHVISICMRLLRPIRSAYNNQWKDLLPPNDEKLSELQHALVNRDRKKNL